MLRSFSRFDRWFSLEEQTSLRRILMVVLLMGLMIFPACATQPDVRPPTRPAPASPDHTKSVPAPPAPAPPPKSVEPAPAPSPRLAASRHLTEEARVLLENGQPDEAIRTLERAVNLSPTNGLNFYYLSEAWMIKKDFRQAEEFNRLAARYLKDDPSWAARVVRQAERIKTERWK